MLVPGILSHEINYPYNQLITLVIHPYQQRIVHHINRLHDMKKTMVITNINENSQFQKMGGFQIRAEQVPMSSNLS